MLFSNSDFLRENRRWWRDLRPRHGTTSGPLKRQKFTKYREHSSCRMPFSPLSLSRSLSFFSVMKPSFICQVVRRQFSVMLQIDCHSAGRPSLSCCPILWSTLRLDGRSASASLLCYECIIDQGRSFYPPTAHP